MSCCLAVPLVGLLALPAVVAYAGDTSSSPHGDLATECSACHTSEGWTPLRKPLDFRHDVTGFRLEGAHAGASCGSCHASPVFSHVGTACADCHADSHRGELGFRCDACHTPRTWSNQRQMFMAHSRTRFPLLAAHASLDCDACHRRQKPFEYSNTPTECGECHREAFDQTTSPSHVQVGYSRRCQDCHGIASRTWHEVTNFQHPATFPLVGAHGALPCSACHGATIGKVSTRCDSCHADDYAGATNPNHVAGHFPRTCEVCHDTAAWRPAEFDHNLSAFPLTGAHRQVDCARCHPGGRYTGTPRDCYSCHRDDAAGATNPSHAGFPTTCEVCHSTTAWRPADFNHDNTRFPLTGAHRGVDCARCHAGGRYAGTPTDCVACHRADYNATNDPNHGAAHFPTTCDTCHTTSAWRPASFDHDGPYFPIYSGRHRGEWSACTDCHTNTSDYRQFECILCHAHSDRARVDAQHREVGGYQYNSAACYRCHPRGVGDD